MTATSVPRPPSDGPPTPLHPGEVRVDLGAVRENVATLRRAAGAAEVMAVVKADAYGHGLVPCARAALDGGAGWLGVAQATEALQLRAAGVRAPVLCWLWTPGADLSPLVAAEVDLSVSAPWALAQVVEAAGTAGRTARVHLKVDTGLARGGSTVADWDDLLVATAAAQASGAVEVVGVWSHMARADEPEHPTVRRQVEVFVDALAAARRRGVEPALRHLANSAATLTAPGTHFDLVRPGIAVYGVSPVPQVAGSAGLGLRPAMSLRARLALVKDVPAGQGVSYAHAYTTPTATTLGLVPLGYADGVPRHASGAGPVRVHGAGAVVDTVVAGRVCMDQVVVDLGPGASARFAAGDVVELFGDGTRGGPTAQDWAEAAGTIAYEVVTRVSPRLPRTYLGGSGEAPSGTVADVEIVGDGDAS
jgi:alanine racemase